jgi:hypothetical protein
LRFLAREGSLPDGGIAMPSRMRFPAFTAVVGLVVSGMFALGPPSAAQSCYPVCAGGDARIDALNAPAKLRVDRNRQASVDGTQIGDDSSVKTTLRANKRTRVRPRSAEFFVASGDAYSVVFRVRATRRGQVTLTGCTTAQPTDFDTSNDCASTTIPSRGG